MDDNFLNRRAAFWDNWRSGLDHAIKQFEADSSGKFIDKEDKINVSIVKNFLNSAFAIALKRYHTVLGQQIEALGNTENNDEEE